MSGYTRPRWQFMAGLLALTAISGVGLLLIVELMLRCCFPPLLIDTGIGYDYGPQAKKYGWGYYPDQRVILPAPDTEEIYLDYTNSRGWRDRDHTFANPDQNFRILVIGDSNTFGAAVPAESLYTRVLEKLLLDQGIRAEVISMGYGGWGTDQALEAFQLEGLRYQPNIFLYQFCVNDLRENALNSPQLSQKFPQPALDRQALIPFGYEVEENGHLVRKERTRTLTIYQRLKQLLQPTEIGMRILYLKRKIFQETLAFQKPYYVDEGRKAYVHYALRTVHPDGIGGQPLPGCEEYIQQIPDGFHTEHALRVILHEKFPQTTEKDLALVMRMLESQHIFHAKPSTPGQLYPDHVHRDASLETHWKLFEQLVLRMKTLADQAGIHFMVFAAWSNLALFEWETFWFHYPETSLSRERYLSPRTALFAFCRTQNIPAIPNVRERDYTRPRNDPHAGIAGNKAMACDIADFLLKHEYIPSRYMQDSEQ